jgi:hypothetical protein
MNPTFWFNSITPSMVPASKVPEHRIPNEFSAEMENGWLWLKIMDYGWF